MSSWAALNIEPAEAVEEEVDDTKEIQIEEALKLYQNALKLHSQGPPFYAQAGEAYDALLNSEIFKYPESISDYKRNALQYTEVSEPLDYATGPAAVEPLESFDVNDSTSSTLLQTIYLSYKNHGQYLLDSLRALLQTHPTDSDDSEGLSAETVKRASAALNSFADALECDDTDLNLWRQSARLSSALKSFRLARYCLESVLADDENRLEVRTEQLGLEETFAEEHLRETLRSLGDRMAVAHVPIKKPKKALLKFLKSQSDPYPYLPTLPKELEDIDPSRNSLAFHTSRYEIEPAAPTWVATGQSILELLEHDEEAPDLAPGAAVGIALPVIQSEAKATTKDIQPASEPPKQEENQDSTPEKPDAHMEGSDDQPTQAEQPLEPSAKPEGHDGTSGQADEHTSIDQRAEKQLMELLEVQPSQSSQPAESGKQEEPANADDQDAKPSGPGSRKRSSASAMPDDQTEPTRGKSRRTRLRESNVDSTLQPEEVAFDQTKYYEDRLEEYVQADDALFNTVEPLLRKVGIEELGNIAQLRKLAYASDAKDTGSPCASTKAEWVLPGDLKDIINSWDDVRSRAFAQGDNLSSLQDMRGMGKSGLAIFLDHSKKSARKLGLKPTFTGTDELVSFVEKINETWLQADEVAFDWLRCLLMPALGDNRPGDIVSEKSDFPDLQSTYTLFQWGDTLKETVVQLLILNDQYTFKRSCGNVESLENQLLCQTTESPFRYTLQHYADLEMFQTIFELHLDIYASINNPNSEVDQETRIAQKDRVARWCMLARTALTHFMDHTSPGTQQDNITLRHIWTSTFFSNMTSDAEREHVLLCLHELKHLLHCLKDPVLTLVNNATMPEISTAAVDQEISKLKSMDFFMKIFNPESEDPVNLIETIEPILEPSSVQFGESQDGEPSNDADVDQSTSQILEMGSFLDRGDATLRLFLWKRLQDAYKKIDYPPKVVSCYLRTIEIILKEITSPAHLEEPNEHRQLTLIRWLKSLDGIVKETVTTVLGDVEKAFECFDEDHLKSSMSAVAQLMKVLYSFVMYEDSVRVGQTSGPEVRGTLARSVESFREKLREMHVRCWALQYTLLKEAMSQNKDNFDTPIDDRINYLRAVHNTLGLRKLCSRSQKQFLKLMKSEILELDLNEDLEFDVCQLLYDIHGIRLSPVDNLLVDHGCYTERVDRATSAFVMDFVIKQAKKMNIRDLSKSELKATMDKMQAAIGITKSSPPLTYNKRVVSSYLKSPINPSELFSAIRGVEDLPLIPVPTESSEMAQKGWYFLLGHSALTKFRSQKRLNPVSTTELDEAVAWFRQDIEHRTQRWESWYRLAQTYDSKLEEDITWSADKINNNKAELVTYQRYAIHAYAMAISTAIRYAEPTPETRSLLADLFTDFGIRLYSSSREPLSMAAFSIADITRHYNSEDNKQMYEAKPFQQMRLYSVWNLAGFLLKKAIADKPKNWMTHYMLSKCLWKMYSCTEEERGPIKPVKLDFLVDSLLDAIDALPQKKDSRSDPIFEPHFKLVTIVHKLVSRGDLTPNNASKTLAVTPWARKVEPLPEDQASWKTYILTVLRNLKGADKSNWHHRMAVRSAHVMYDDDQTASAALAAKSELTQQIFTKTMTIQVWRPEYERPGRHFVYTSRYVYFFVALLDQLDDRVNLDQLLRRVRKKQGDFINHTKLWEDVCLTYARVIRRAGNINEGHEEGVFRPIGWEEFVANTARLESLTQFVPESQTLLELLRDAVELKKLNNNLMKVSLLEDLIADLYSRLYEVNMPQVLEQANEENKEKMKVDHLLMGSDGAADTPTPPTSAPASEAPAPRGRTKGIARRDIQKRAETIVNRRLGPRAPAAKIPVPAETEPPQPSGETSVIVTAPSDAEQTKDEAPAQTDPPAEGPGTAPQSDGPNSVHDSADDESELSEMDEDRLSKLSKERKNPFPNLQDRASAEPGSELSGQVDADAANEAPGDGDEDVDREGDTALGDGEEEGDEGADGADGEDVDMEGDGGDEENENDNDNENENEVGAEEEDGADAGEPEDENDGENEGEGEGEGEVEAEAEGDEGDGEENDNDTAEAEGTQQEAEVEEPEQANAPTEEKEVAMSSDVDRMDI